MAISPERYARARVRGFCWPLFHRLCMALLAFLAYGSQVCDRHGIYAASRALRHAVSRSQPPITWTRKVKSPAGWDQRSVIESSNSSSKKKKAKRMAEDDEFQWDYSYFKWQDIPRQVRRQMVLDRSMEGRTWMRGRTWVVADVTNQGARAMYNNNWDGCRDLWKENYRRAKLLRFHTDRPITPPDLAARVRTPVSRTRASQGGPVQSRTTKTLRGVASETKQSAPERLAFCMTNSEKLFLVALESATPIASATMVGRSIRWTSKRTFPEIMLLMSSRSLIIWA